MPYLEYPKYLYKVDAEPRLVKDADGEAAATAEGFAPAATVYHEGVEASPAALSAEHLEYPKHVYKGEGDDRVSIVVKDAEGEAAAAEDGYLALSAPTADEDAPAAGDKPKGKRKSKA